MRFADAQWLRCSTGILRVIGTRLSSIKVNQSTNKQAADGFIQPCATRERSFIRWRMKSQSMDYYAKKRLQVGNVNWCKGTMANGMVTRFDVNNWSLPR
jgi:hypothetical protein